MKDIYNQPEIQRLLQGREVTIFHHKELRNPSILYINLDERCNENCVFCVVKGKNTGTFGSMKLEEAKKIIKEFLNKKEGKELVFTGGEPTLRKDLSSLIKYAEKFPSLKSISIITNGVLLGNKQIFNTISQADKRKIVNFSISLHSHKKQISELLTQSKGTYEYTLRGISHAIQNNYKVSIYQVITTKNYKDLLGFCKFLNKNFPQINKITLAYPFPQGNALLNTWIFPKLSALRFHLLRALQYLRKKGYDITIASCGQFPLCLVPGFEKDVLKNVEFSEENILGVIGMKTFHDFEMASDEWQTKQKTKSKLCRRCILNKICPGFWIKYVELYGFNGIKVVTFQKFKGNKLQIRLNNNNDIQLILNNLNKDMVNVIKLLEYNKFYFQRLIIYLSKYKILSIILNKNNKVIYPF